MQYFNMKNVFFITMNRYKRYFFVMSLALFAGHIKAQNDIFGERLVDAEEMPRLEYQLATQVSAADYHTPLWLNANKYGLSSLMPINGYLRASVRKNRMEEQGALERLSWGAGLDVLRTFHYKSSYILHQAYAELKWWHGMLVVGAKRHEMQLKNQSLSSGSQTLGINAATIPQVRLELPDYYTIPALGGWLQIKGHIAYGKLTDSQWQKQFTSAAHSYSEGILYHSKAGYLRIGNAARFYPFSVELGLEMATLYGGMAHVLRADGTMQDMPGQGGLKGMINALVAGGHDYGESVYQNVSGNVLGSWLCRLNYDTDQWYAALYADHFFEDHSSMFFLDYDGYGTGEQWNVKSRRKYFVYDLKDIMLGMELKLKHFSIIRNVVWEYLHTKYQSGPIYHDHTMGVSDHIGGRDNYYNHYIYTGWQHWGQVIGNPLYRSPQYNTDGDLEIQNNRFIAYHLGISGDLLPQWQYRLLGTYQRGWGRYDHPYAEVRKNQSLLFETVYHLPKDWCIMLGLGMDQGKILGNNYGLQLTVSKKGILLR